MSTLKVNTIQTNTGSGVDIDSPLDSINVTNSATIGGNLQVNNILPSIGTNVAIGTAGGSVTLTGSVTGSSIINTGVTTVSAGSTSAPSISPTGDSNTGIFFPSSDTIAFAEGGVEALRVDSGGNIGIGTISISFSQFGSNTGGVAIADIGATNTGLKISDGAYHNYLVQAGNSNLYISHYGASGDMIFGVGSSGEERAKITSTGNVEIANGNLVFSTAGKGIDFSATANSSGTMTSELLSDYEEGTFSPFSAADVTNRGIVIPTQAFYVKIGRICHIWFRFYYSNTASSAQIAGNLPFAGNSPTISAGYSPFFLSIFPRAGSPSHMGFCYNDSGNNTAFSFYQNNANYVSLNWNSGCTEYTVIGAYQTT